jgi:hypothetical protein
MVVALAAETRTIWWITLGLGAVVAAVVVVLLHLLLRAVIQVEASVTSLWDVATRVARNTATSWQLGSTAKGLDAIKSEALRHDALLSTDGHSTREQLSSTESWS